MKSHKSSYRSLSDYVDYLQSRGTYVFTQKEAKEAIGCSEWSVRISANRLMAKKRITKLRYTFYLIIPLEYRSANALPATWYIDALMDYHKQPYYVALLSAAALYGAAHQQPQVFQVMTNKALRPIKVGRTKIQFLVKKNIQKYDIIKKLTETGYINVSTPEVTAFDLIRYADRAGSLNFVVTVLIELSETIDPKKLVKAAQNEKTVISQRLGYLFDKYNKREITKQLHIWLSKQKTRFTPLITGKDYQGSQKNKDWKILINEKIEVDNI